MPYYNLRFEHEYRLAVFGGVEIDLVVDTHCGYDPGYPPVTSGPPDNWDPGTGPEFDWTGTEITAIRMYSDKTKEQQTLTLDAPIPLDIWSLRDDIIEHFEYGAEDEYHTSQLPVEED